MTKMYILLYLLSVTSIFSIEKRGNDTMVWLRNNSVTNSVEKKFQCSLVEQNELCWLGDPSQIAEGSGDTYNS